MMMLRSVDVLYPDQKWLDSCSIESQLQKFILVFVQHFLQSQVAKILRLLHRLAIGPRTTQI